MAHTFSDIRTLAIRPWSLPAAWLVLAGACPAALADSTDDFLAAADRGECIESVAYRMLRQGHSADPMGVVASALRALSKRHEQQRSLGCEGDIAAQAIAAGVDPEQVLAATAAGL